MSRLGSEPLEAVGVGRFAIPGPILGVSDWRWCGLALCPGAVSPSVLDMP
jgi:hypothetical protein